MKIILSVHDFLHLGVSFFVEDKAKNHRCSNQLQDFSTKPSAKMVYTSAENSCVECINTTENNYNVI